MIYEYLFKYILVGDTGVDCSNILGVGKSCILSSFLEQKFQQNHDVTIGVEFGSKIILIDNKPIKLQIWDTAGQESYKSITRSYYRSAAGAILVYDITKRSSFEHIVQWLQEISQNGNNSVTIILVGNKKDLEKNRVVSFDEGQQFAIKNNLLFFETSAKTAVNVQNIFYESVKNIDDKITHNLIDLKSEVNINQLIKLIKNCGVRQAEGRQQGMRQEPLQHKYQVCC